MIKVIPPPRPLYNTCPFVRGTCLERDSIIEVPTRIIQRCTEEFGDSTSLVLGHMVQYTHDELLAQRFSIYPSKTREVFDRMLQFSPQYQDDKVATFETDDGLLSTTHNISHGEYDAWMNNLKAGIDTAIHCFEYTDKNYTHFKYRGSVSFKLLVDVGELGIRAGKKSYFFNREPAYRHNLL